MPGISHTHPMLASMFGMPYPTTFSGVPLPMVFRPLIERVAHLLWESRGRQPGYDFQNWIEAEHIVRHQLHCGSGF
jgi:hypothetical protein